MIGMGRQAISHNLRVFVRAANAEVVALCDVDRYRLEFSTENPAAVAVAQRRGASSKHPGGANFAFVDGSLRFISETISFSRNGRGYQTTSNDLPGLTERDIERRRCGRDDLASLSGRVTVQLANGYFRYLPTERSVAGGAYGAIPESNEADPEAGPELVERTLEMIESLWEEKE